MMIQHLNRNIRDLYFIVMVKINNYIVYYNVCDIVLCCSDFYRRSDNECN